MQGGTHFIAGLAIGLGLLTLDRFQMPLTESLACLSVAGVGSLFPDIDTPDSKLGHMVKPLALAINKSFGHRGITHSPLLVVILFAFLEILLPDHHNLAIFFAAGMVSHLLLDMLNHKGIPLLYPLPVKFHIANFKNASVEELVIRMAFNITAFLLCFYHVKGMIQL